MLYSICQQIWKSQQWPQDWKRSVFIPVLKKTNAKECSNYHTLALISYASKVILNFSKQSLRVHEPRTSRCSSWTYKRQRNQRSNCQHLLDHRKSKRIPEKHLSSVQSLSRVQLFATLWTTASQASLSITNFWSLPKLMSIESVMPSNHLILCRPLLLLPSVFPNIRVFSNESALCIRWPKYWSFYCFINYA